MTESPGSGKTQLAFGILGITAAIVIAFAVFAINAELPDRPDRAIQLAAGLFALVGAAAVGVYFYSRPSPLTVQLGELGLVLIGSVLVLSTAAYLFWAGEYVFFRADIFIWSESDFVNDIIKFRQCYPIFTDQINNESFTYLPGAQLLTYFLAYLVGEPTSIPTYRAIQVLYTILSAVVAYACCRRLVQFGKNGDAASSASFDSPRWGMIWLPGLFLVATNSLTNPFTHLLHNDALAQLTTLFAYWLLVEYEATRDRRILWIMVLVPGAGFWVKQSLIIWALIYAAYLFVFDSHGRLRTKIIFALTAAAVVGISYWVGKVLWGDNFTYWAFTVLGSHGVNPLQSVKHLLDVGGYYIIGLIGGAILLPGNFKRLTGLWLVWLFTIFTETYTSGIAWMLNHIGPGTLIAGIWFFAALPAVWDKIGRHSIRTAGATDWLYFAVASTSLVLMFYGLGMVRIPQRPFDRDAYRYINEIEREFDGEDPHLVLLDLGSWIYLKDGVVMKDRAPSIGERGYSQTGDFSGILARLRAKYYQKVLVRNLDSPDFWYDHSTWSKSSGIRQAMLENYREIRRIDAVSGMEPIEMPYGFQNVYVLVPAP